jgi:UTP:GlnB (protein PII) uridylyltransferase
MHDLCADRFQKAVHLVDVAAFAGAQAYVMQTDAPLLEFLCAMRIVASDNAHRSPSADAVERLLAANHRLESQVGEQLFVEWKARLEIADREHHMRDPVYFHRFFSAKDHGRQAAATSSNTLTSLNGAGS